MNTQSITLDVSKEPSVAQVVRIGQGDVSGTTIAAAIYDNGTALDLTGCTARFRMLLPDGTHSLEDSNCTVSGSTITYVVDEEHAASCAGKTDVAYFDILQGDTVICSTQRFVVIVLRDATGTAAEAWTNGLDELIADADAAVDAAEAATTSATSAATAATTAAESANTAATTATTAAGSADTATAAATSAASSANSSATAATTAAANANTATSAANTAASNATTATTAAETATTAATTATTAAETATTNANAATTAANTAAAAATAAAESANSAAAAATAAANMRIGWVTDEDGDSIMAVIETEE